MAMTLNYFPGIPVTTYTGTDGENTWPAYSHEQVLDAYRAGLSAQAEVQVTVTVTDDDVDNARQAAYDVPDISNITRKAMRAALESFAARLSQGTKCEECAKFTDYLKEGQSPFDRFVQERKDCDGCLELLRQERMKIERMPQNAQGEAVYQSRYRSIEAGWSEWSEITKDRYDELELAIKRGACSQTRILYTHPAEIGKLQKQVEANGNFSLSECPDLWPEWVHKAISDAVKDAERAAVPDGLDTLTDEQLMEFVAIGLRHAEVKNFQIGDLRPAFKSLKAMLTAAPRPPEGARVVDDGAARIATERRRHKEAKGYSQQRDLQYESRELVDAAIAYAMVASADADDRRKVRTGSNNRSTIRAWWPWPQFTFKPGKDDSDTSRVRELEKAGALLAAEIDRLLAAPTLAGTERMP